MERSSGSFNKWRQRKFRFVSKKALRLTNKLCVTASISKFVHRQDVRERGKRETQHD